MNGAAINRYWVLLGVAALVVLFWFFSIADPCRFNAIAITECSVRDGMVTITNGDAVERLAALFLLMALFGFGVALLEAHRTVRSLVGIAAAGVSLAFAIYEAVNFTVFVNATLEAVGIAAWIASMIVAGLAVSVGARVAASTAPQ